MNAISFNKSGSSQKPLNVPDTIKSDDTVEALFGLGEGPWRGFTNSAHSFYIDDTPLVNASGAANFTNFQLTFNPGSALGESIKSKLGGFGAGIVVGQNLLKDTPVTRDGVQTQIDFLEVRFVIGALYTSTDRGLDKAPLKIHVEYKALSSPTWVPAYTNDAVPNVPADTTPDGNVFDLRGKKLQQFALDNVQAVLGHPILQGTTPAEPDDHNSIWLDTSNDNRPSIWDADTSSWVLAASSGDLSDFGYWVFNDNGVIRHVYPPTENPPVGAIAGALWSDGIETMLIYNGASWTFGTLDFSEYYSNGSTDASGVMAFNAKITSSTVKEIRWPVARIDEPYEIRITKLSDDQTTSNIVSLQWESFQEVKAQEFIFPNTSTLQIVARASDQFTSVGTFSGIFDMKLVAVPVNFDPETRVYDGTWDGTFKMAWTDSIPWILRDFVENDRFGLSTILPHTVNKWRFYEWGQWTDEMIDDGAGGQRPRWTFNNWQAEAMAAKEFANYIAGAGCARIVDDGNGFIDVIVDKDEDATALFTKENVVDGDFKYSFTDVLSRANDVVVRYQNPDTFYAEDRRRVVDQDDIDANGRRTFEFEAFGCRNTSEAIARARYRLISSKTEKQLVNFKTQRKGRYLRAYQIILIADPDMDNGLSGRIRAVTGARTVSLRDPVSLEAGIDYVATFDIVNPDYPDNSSSAYITVERNITTGAGTHMSLAFDADLPELAEKAVFAIAADEDFGTPKAYRVLDIKAPEGDADNVEITAIEYNRNKWPFIEGSVPEPDITQYTNQPKIFVKPVTNLKVALSDEFFLTTTTRVVTLNWDDSESKFVRRYRVLASLDGGPAALIQETDDNQVEIRNLAPGRYVFSVIAIDIRGPESEPTSTGLNIAGERRTLFPPINLALVGGDGGNNYTGRDARIAYEPGLIDADFSHYIIRVLNVDTNDQIREENNGQALTWTYDAERQEADGMARSVRIVVVAADQLGNESDPTSIIITNPTPGVPTVTIEEAIAGYTVTALPSGENDVIGMLVWESLTSGFDPEEVDPIVDQTPGSVFIQSHAGDEKFVRVAFYDAYGKTDLNISAEQSVTAHFVDTDAIADEAIDVAKFAQGISAPTIEDTLPVTGNFEGRLVVLTTDGKMYRYHSGAWTGAVPAVDITGTISTSQIADSAITVAKFASGITPVEVLSTLPSIGNFEGRQVALTTDGKLYRYHSGAFTAAVAAVDVSGQIASAQIADGAVIAAKIADAVITTAKFASGITPVEILSTLPGSGNFEGRQVALTTDGKLYRYHSGAFTVAVPAVDITGQIASAQIADAAVIAAKIADGVLTTAKFASGLTPVEIVSTLPSTGNFTGRTVLLTTDGKLYRYFSGAFVGTVAAADITGTITSTQITDGAISTPKLAANAVTAAKIAAGTITANEIASDTITAAQIAAGAITASELAVQSVTASKMLITDTSNMLNDPLLTDGTYWGMSAGVASSTSSEITGNLSAPSGIAITGTGATSGATLEAIPDARFYPIVETGKSYRASYQWRASIGFTGQFSLILAWYDQSKTLLSSSTIGSGTDYRTVAAAAATNGAIEGMAAAPANAAFVRYRIRATMSTTLTNAGTGYAANPRLNRAASAELIVDGTITAAKIQANTITASQIAAGTITTTQIAASTITGSNIAAGTITASNIATDTITASQIAAGAISTSELAANSITASKLVISDTTNLLLDADFSDTTYWATGGSGWVVGSTDTLITSQTVLSATKGAKTEVGNGTTTQAQTSIAVPTSSASLVEPGKNYRVLMRTAVKTGYTGRLFIQVQWQRGDGTVISNGSITGPDYRTVAAAADTVTVFDGQITAPTDAYKARFTVQSQWSTTLTNAQYAVVAGVRFMRAVNAELIVDGTITAAKIQANTITASQIAAGTITATEIAASTITGAKIAAGTITASNIATDTITASQIAAGAINASELAAQAVTASKLAVTDTFNLVTDPLFNDSTYWSYSSGVAASTDSNITGNLSAPSGIAITGTGQTSGATPEATSTSNYYAVVETGKSYRGNAQTRVSVGFTGVFTLYVAWYTQAKVLISSSQLAIGTDYRTVAAAAATNATLEGVAAAPATAAYARIGIRATMSTTLTNAGTAYAANPRLNRAMSAELIVDGTITAAKLVAGTITANEIAASTITGSKIAAGTITASNIATDTITASQIAAGAIGASEVAAGAIIASKLSVTDFANLITDPLFDDVANTWTSSGTGITMPSTSSNIAANLYARQGVAMAGAGQTSGAVSYVQTVLQSPVEGGRNYRFAYDFGWLTGFTGSMSVCVFWKDQAGADISNSGDLSYFQDNRSIAATSNLYVANSFTWPLVAPASARYATVRMKVLWSSTLTNGGTAYFANPRLQRMGSGELIVDGSITATKISVSTLSAISADLGTITAGSLNIGSGKFQVASDGTVTIQNSASGQRLVITNSLLSVYDASNVLRVRLGIW